jgi:hypothetical protein
VLQWWAKGPYLWVGFRWGRRGHRVKGAQKALGMEEEVRQVGPCLKAGEDGIGGVVVKPRHLRSGQPRAVIEDVGMGPKGPAVRTVCMIIRHRPEGCRVVRCEAVTCDYLEGRGLESVRPAL